MKAFIIVAISFLVIVLILIVAVALKPLRPTCPHNSEPKDISDISDLSILWNGSYFRTGSKLLCRCKDGFSAKTPLGWKHPDDVATCDSQCCVPTNL